MEILPFSKLFYYLFWGHSVSWIFFLIGCQNWGLHPGRWWGNFQRHLYLLFFTLPGAVALYFLLVHITKVFQNMIFCLVPSTWLPGSGSFPYQLGGKARDQLKGGHKEKGLQSQEQQCHVTSSLCHSCSSNATALGHWPKQHLPHRDRQTPHISWPHGEHQQLRLPKCNVHVCGWW